MITVIVMSVTISLPIAVLLFLSWLQNRTERSLLWWSGSLLVSLTGLGLYGPRGRISDFITIDLANAAILVGLSLGLAGARAFNGRRTPWWVLVLAPAFWVAALRIPELHDTAILRFTGLSILNATLVAAIALEYWRGRGDELIARYLLTATLSLLSLVYLSRVALVILMPLPDPRDYLDSNVWATFSLLGPIVIGISNAVLVLAAANERAEAAQRRIAEIDPLTLVPNRGGTLARIETELARNLAGGSAVLLFDLDHFKQINDQYGHPAGDHMLRRFAKIAVANLREQDIFGRIGGEEFLAFLSDVDQDQAIAVAEQIRKAFAIMAVAENGMRICGTVSIGVAIAEGPGRDIDMLLMAADKALYGAKEAGRDRVRSVKSAAA